MGLTKADQCAMLLLAHMHRMPFYMYKVNDGKIGLDGADFSTPEEFEDSVTRMVDDLESYELQTTQGSLLVQKYKDQVLIGL